MLVSNVSEDIKTERAKQDWLAYWQHFSTCEDRFCSEVNCLNPQHHGVLVKRQGAGNDELFVIPLCKEHSENPRGQLELSDKTEVISASLTL
jgi:hypothetical protein